MNNTTSSTAALPAANTICYQLDFARFYEHLVDVTLTFTAHTDAPELWLPAWIPGSYLMREFARNITAVHYQPPSEGAAETADIQRAQKIDKHTWQLPNIQAGQKVAVHYEVYCYDLSVRTAYVDQCRLYGNFTSLALAISGQEMQPVMVNLMVPMAFINAQRLGVVAAEQARPVTIACGLAETQLSSDEQQVYRLAASSYHELIDYPFEIGAQDRFDFIVQDDTHQTLGHRFFLAGKHSANMGRLQQDVTQICQSYVNWLGDAPFADYTFMTYASGQDYGGLEHINSTSLVTPRRDLPRHDEPENPSSAYQRFLGLCSHEYFHAWWVKTVRPDVMLAVDLRREAFTPLLWVFEGFTSYIDDFMLQASGVIDKSSYLTLLGEQISRYYQTHGRAYQSVAESSFDAWIKLYRSDENTGNAGISYYNKGALVALCLDLTLLQHSGGRYRLFDVVKAFYDAAKAEDKRRIGISSADMGAMITQFMSAEAWQAFEQRYVNGVDELPLEPLLLANGVSMHDDHKETAAKHIPLGMRCTETPSGLKVNRVQRGSMAAQAGISANDVIIAIDGIKADIKQLATLQTTMQQAATKDADDKTAVVCHVFRRDELLSVTITASMADKQPADGDKRHKVNLRFVKDKLPAGDSGAAMPLWQSWLGAMDR